MNQYTILFQLYIEAKSVVPDTILSFPKKKYQQNASL